MELSIAIIGYFLPLLLNILILTFLLICTKHKAYIVHILLGITMFFPIINFLPVLIFAFQYGAGNIKLKPNKITKFLFDYEET